MCVCVCVCVCVVCVCVVCVIHCHTLHLGAIHEDSGLVECDKVLATSLFTEESLRMVWNNFPPHLLQVSTQHTVVPGRVNVYVHTVCNRQCACLSCCCCCFYVACTFRWGSVHD